MKALVLSGGGSKGAFQLGVLKNLMLLQNEEYQLIVGVSVGALNAAGIGMFPYGSSKEAISWLENFWIEHVNSKTIYKRWCPFGKLHSLWEKSIYNSKPLQELVRGNYVHEKLINSGRQIIVGAVSLNTGEYRYVDQTDPNFVDWILASSSYPVFFEPISIEGGLWSDGGIRGVTPLGQAIRSGADEIDVIMTSPIEVTGEWNSSSAHAVPDQIIRVLDLMNRQIVESDIKMTGLKNDLADLGQQYRKVKIRLFYPHSNLGDGLDFNTEQIIKNIEIGFNEAKLVEILH